MKFYVLASSASILLGAVPGVFSSEEYKLRGSTSAVAKSIENFDKVLHAASAAKVLHSADFDEDDCKGYKPESAKDDECSEAYTGCCTALLYNENKDFCECAGFDKPKGIILDTPWTFNSGAHEEKCDTAADVKYTCVYDTPAPVPAPKPAPLPSASAVAKSIENFDEVLHAASAAITGKDFDEDDCDGYKPDESKHAECKAPYDACCTALLYKDNKDFCECMGFDDKGIILDTPWTFNAADDKEECKTTAGVKYTCVYDDDDDDKTPAAN